MKTTKKDERELALRFPKFNGLGKIEVSIIGKGKRAYLRVGAQIDGESVEIAAGAMNNGVRLRRFFRAAMRRLEPRP
jgi:hypothetical protein